MRDLLDTRRFSRLGWRIYFRLLELKKDQAWLSAQTCKAPQAISSLMKLGNPNTRTLGELAEALDVPPSFFMC